MEGNEEELEKKHLYLLKIKVYIKLIFKEMYNLSICPIDPLSLISKNVSRSNNRNFIYLIYF